jgi:hypothetical protein
MQHLQNWIEVVCVAIGAAVVASGWLAAKLVTARKNYAVIMQNIDVSAEEIANIARLTKEEIIKIKATIRGKSSAKKS